ncbi:MAG: hypothetical protein ACUVUC_16950, partial [Thermoguttaceae bacterium]
LAVAGVWLVWSQLAGTAEGTLVLNWPESERAGGTLSIDGQAAELARSGPLEYPLPPGQHTLTAARPGYRTFEQLVRVQPGKREPVSPRWSPLPNLTLDWPEAERVGAMLEIDGRLEDIELLALRSSPGLLDLTLAPGEHRITIKRLGYEPYDKVVSIPEGKQQRVRPGLKELPAGGQAPLPAKPAASGPVSPAEPKQEPAEPKPEPVVAKPEPPEPQEDPILKRRRGLAARWAEGMKPVEALVASWEFAAAQKAAEGLRFEEPELSARLAARRQELPRLGAFKQRIMDRINTAQPPLKKFDLGLSGQNGDVLKADQQGLTAKTLAGKIELHRWAELSQRARSRLIELPVDPQSAEDWLAAGLMALAFSDPVLAEGHFEKARTLGAQIDAYLEPLAEAALARAEALLAGGQEALGQVGATLAEAKTVPLRGELAQAERSFQQAAAALDELESKYGGLAWFLANKPVVAAARQQLTLGLQQTEAERLYAEAVEFFAQKEFYDLKPLVEELKTRHGTSRAVTEATRKVPFAEMEKATTGLGPRLTVALKGKADFRSIRAAIDAAKGGELIEILDNGPYREYLTIPAPKMGLTLRGKRGVWPVVTSLVSKPEPDRAVLAIFAPRTTVQRVVLLHINGLRGLCLALLRPCSARLNNVLMYATNNG